MKVIITGGAGFIGANLARTLCDDDRFGEVVVVDDLSTGDRANLDGVDADLRVGTILDRDLLDAAMQGASGVVHLAARPSVPRSIQDPVASHLANATGTLEVLEAARRAGGAHVIVASSSSVYGANPTLPKSEDLRTEPLSPYGVSKLATEAYAIAYQHCYDLPTLAFRFFNVFGPLQPAGHAYAAVVPAFVDAALRGQPIPIDGDGLQSRDFTSIGSVTSAITDALARRVTSQTPVNLAFGGRATLLEVIDLLEGILGRPLERLHRDPRVGDVRHSQADPTRFTSLFPDLRPVDLEVGLRETVAWFRSLPTYADDPTAGEPAAAAGAGRDASAGRDAG